MAGKKRVVFLLTGYFIQFNSKGIPGVCSRWYPGQAAFSKESSWILADEIFCIIWWSYFISDFWTGQIVHLDLILPHFIVGLNQIFRVCANWPWRSSLLLHFYDIDKQTACKLCNTMGTKNELELFVNIYCLYLKNLCRTIEQRTQIHFDTSTYI